MIANYTTWLGTKSKVEVTMQLDGWIIIGSLKEGELRDLRLTYKDQSINNVLKLSWRISNSGTIGIEHFETTPTLQFPSGLKIQAAKVSQLSPMLKINNKVHIDKEKFIIRTSGLGIFNPNDYFTIDVYIIDVPDEGISNYFFDQWELKAKSVDLRIKKDVRITETTSIRRRKKIYILGAFFYIGGILVGILISTIFRRFRKGK